MRMKMLCIMAAILAIGLTLPCVADTLLASRFGVFPTVQYIENWEYASGEFYSGYQFNLDSLVPTKNTGSVDYQIDDWFGYWSTTELDDYVSYPGTGTYPAGDEPYDTEAYYFDDDEDKLYFATIIGFHTPEWGVFLEERFSFSPVVQGDFAIDFGMPGSQTDDWEFNYNYGVDITDEIRPVSGNVTDLRSFTVGTGVYYTTDGWYLGTPDGAVNPVQPDDPSNAFTNFDPNWNGGDGMTWVGDAEVTWYQLDLYDDGNPVLENNWETWVIEISIPKSIVPNLSQGDELSFRWLAGCRNDGNQSEGFITGHGTIITPEPSTMLLFALGAGPLGLWLRRRKQGDAG